MVPARHPVTGQDFVSPVSPGTGWPQDPATSATPSARDGAEVVELAAGAGTVGELDARVSVCRACDRLVAWREQVAVVKRRAYADQPYWGRPGPGNGDPGARLLVVGLAPGAHGTNRTGRLFTGDRSGEWIHAALSRAGFASQPNSDHAGDGLRLIDARIVAAVRCAPPDNRPSTTERDTCAPWLRRDLDLAADSVQVVLALGGFGWDAAVRTARTAGWDVPRPRPRFGHGARTVLATSAGRPVTLLGSYHVSQQNTSTGRLTRPMLDQVLAEARSLVGPLP